MPKKSCAKSTPPPSSLRQVRQVERRDPEHRPGALGVAGGDDRRVDPEEAALVEEAVDGHRQRVPHPGDGAEGVGPRPEVGDRPQVLEACAAWPRPGTCPGRRPSRRPRRDRPGSRPTGPCPARRRACPRRRPSSRWSGGRSRRRSSAGSTRRRPGSGRSTSRRGSGGTRARPSSRGGCGPSRRSSRSSRGGPGRRGVRGSSGWSWGGHRSRGKRSGRGRSGADQSR